MKKKDFSIRYINSSYAYLMTFFSLNGYKIGRALEVERYHMTSRCRKREEYIPTSEDAWNVIDAAGTPKNRAIIACLFSSGLRNSTLRALTYKDVRQELEEGKEVVKVSIYPEMKSTIPRQAKLP